MSKVTIIAEAGVNHNGSLELAFKLIEVAKNCGADIVKFQTAVPELVMTASADKAEYQKQKGDKNESQLDMAKKIHLPLEAFEDIQAYCNRIGIEFLSTPFDLNSLEYLEKLGLETFKIPSGELTNLPYLESLGKLKKKIIMSTGMATLDEVNDAIYILTNAGTDKNQITVLHCNTDYPTNFSDVNLNAMLTLKRSLNIDVGYSDHTNGIEVPIAATALGAKIIEKHFTLDKNMEGPDHKASLDPKELKAMVDGIRNIESALGDGIKIPSESEKKNLNIVRKSIVAKKLIKKGEFFSDKNLTTKRPGTGMSPMKWYEIMGNIAKKNYQPDELI